MDRTIYYFMYFIKISYLVHFMKKLFYKDLLTICIEVNSTVVEGQH